MVALAWIFEARHGDDSVVKAFNSFSTALMANGAFTNEELATYVTSLSASDCDPSIVYAEWTPCPFCSSYTQVRRKGGSFALCPNCGVRLYVTHAGKKKLHVKIADGGTLIAPRTLEEAYRRERSPGKRRKLCRWNR